MSPTSSSKPLNSYLYGKEFFKTVELYDFSYELPLNFDSRAIQMLMQLSGDQKLHNAFKKCKYEYEDVGLAYYAGMKGDNWNKRALDFTFEGSKKAIFMLQNQERILRDAISKALKSSKSGFLLRNIVYLESDDNVFYRTDEERLNADMNTANMFLKDLLRIGEKLCSNATYSKKSSENSINDFFRDMLSCMGCLPTNRSLRNC